MNIFFQIIVSYDISDTKVRNVMFDKLKDFGLTPIQKSVMWGYVNNAEERAIKNEIQNQLLENSDKCIILRVNNAAQQIKKYGFGYNDFSFQSPEDISIV